MRVILIMSRRTPSHRPLPAALTISQELPCTYMRITGSLPVTPHQAHIFLGNRAPDAIKSVLHLIERSIVFNLYRNRVTLIHLLPVANPLALM